MDAHSGPPEPPDGGDARRDPAESLAGEWAPDEDGPFFAWLPPEDRLWRHPSEAEPAGAPPGSLGEPVASGSRWSGMSPRTALRSSWVVALVAGLVGATAATGVGIASGMWPHDTTVVRSVVASTPSVSLADIGAQPVNWNAIDDSVASSVVGVSVDGAAGPEMGSGLVILQAYDGTGYVVTDRSLFVRGQEAGYIGDIDVLYPSGVKVKARLLDEDPLSGLAILEVADSGQAVAANMGTVADLRNADSVLAVGSRNGPSLYLGLVSGEDRTVDLADGTDLDGLLAVAMSPLGSPAYGGPLLDQSGQVVGITVSLDPVDSADQQFTFAVPVDEVARVATQIIEGGQLTHPWLGVTDAEDLPSVMARQLGLTGGVQAGVVSPSSPAGQAGIHADDVITSLDGKPVLSTGDLMAQLNSCTPGRTVPISYVHSGRTVQTSVRIGNEPQDS